ncbi:SDR family oxidoreductase [Rahnella sp. C60]|uniref:SDR family NAD(P)-dependent oxidoreductase n=1 Tax=Rahnella TaxID=34037 RepID=UPI00101FE50F|nr:MULTISPECIES: SDR family oxidoreductase [Rahnella]MBU9810411.1 SDR family oxidoreductase [Rahnella perminowiae]MBU9814910.1 SDR family oxidoreductase [Rahnella perminowiae]MCX2942262.1 SDR family NAD(P)-dependent oxidoreductase [Rahnella perminowiae]
MNAETSTPGKSRNILITGGSSGIGAATVRAFASRGDQVWFTYHRGEDRALELINALSSLVSIPPQALPYDQGSWESLLQLVDAIPAEIDILVNNAALGTKTVELAGIEERHQQDALFTQVNCLGPLWLTRQFLPGMLKRGYGKILMLSSVDGGIAAFPGFRDTDGMTKAAIAFLTRQWAAELVHDPVEVFCVCPGAVDTPMFRQSTLDPLSSASADELIAQLPKGRLIRPDEIADILWWLTTDAAVIMHGAVIDASMGLGVHPGCITMRNPRTTLKEGVA